MNEIISLSDWIEQTIVLPREISADPGPMRLWPFHRGIAEAIEDQNIERVTLVKPVRVGFSTLLHAAVVEAEPRTPDHQAGFAGPPSDPG